MPQIKSDHNPTLLSTVERPSPLPQGCLHPPTLPYPHPWVGKGMPSPPQTLSSQTMGLSRTKRAGGNLSLSGARRVNWGEGDVFGVKARRGMTQSQVDGADSPGQKVSQGAPPAPRIDRLEEDGA